MTTPHDRDPSAFEETRYAGVPADLGPATGAQAPATGTPPPAAVTRGVGFVTYLVTILAFVIIIAVVVFVTQNTQHITIKYFGHSKSLSIAAALGAAAGAGLVAGLLLASIPQISLRRRLRDYRRAAR